MGNGDTNLNYPTFGGNVQQYLGKTLNSGDIAGLNQQFGYDQSRNNYQFISGGNVYQLQDNGHGGATVSQIDTVGNRQGEAAQQQYQAGVGSAVSGLQTQQSNLAGQYGSLLQTVTGQYQPLINQTTASAGAALAARGLSPDSQLFQQQTQGALQPVYGAEAANTQALGQGSINDMNTLQQAIAQTQLTGASGAAQLPLQYSQLALQQAQNPAQIALAEAQAQEAQNVGRAASYIPVAQGENLFNANSGQGISMLTALAKAMGYNITR